MFTALLALGLSCPVKQVGVGGEDALGLVRGGVVGGVEDVSGVADTGDQSSSASRDQGRAAPGGHGDHG